MRIILIPEQRRNKFLLQIAICDDEESSHSLLQEYFERMMREGCTPFQLVRYTAAETLLAARPWPDILLLDVEMGKGMDGITAAKILREQGCTAVIILVTNYIQYAVDGYEFQAFHFLKKPVEYQRFTQVLRRAMQRADQRSNASTSVRCGDGWHQVSLAALAYCETDRGGVLLHCGSQVLRCRMSISQLEKQLDAYAFFRCHTAYLVNLAEIERIGPTDLSLRDGTVIPVSRHRKKAFREALAAFWGGEYA